LGGVASAEEQWDEVIGVILTGVWNTGRVAISSTIDNGSGGPIVLRRPGAHADGEQR
jgi:tRNA A37 threonylcarbamoyladenosine synthetase subunit TsaC/SUA5/YrdC